MAADDKPVDGTQDRNVEQIRDILFGGQMRDYERRFQELDARIAAELSRLRDEHGKRLAEMNARIDERLEAVGKELRQEAQHRGRSIDDLESRVQEAARSAREEAAASLDAHG